MRGRQNRSLQPPVFRSRNTADTNTALSHPQPGGRGEMLMRLSQTLAHHWPAGIWYHLGLLLSLALHNLLFPLPPTPPPLLPSFSASWLLTHPPLALRPAPTLPRGRFGALPGREDPIQQWGLASRPRRPREGHKGCRVGEATIAPTPHNSIRSWHFQRRVGEEMATTDREQS